MKKFTKKGLRQEAQRLGAFELTKECYHYENDVWYLSHLHYIKTGEDYTKLSDAVLKFLEHYNIKISDFYGSFANASVTQIAYSASSTYGNNGQLQEITFYDKKWEHARESVYVFYTT